VFAAVVTGQRARDVLRAIDACAPRGDERRRAEAVEQLGRKHHDTPLQVAHRKRREDMVALLLEESADAGKVRDDNGRPTTALALCVYHDLPRTILALLRKGRDPSQRLAHDDKDPPAGSDNVWPYGVNALDARDWAGETPLHWAVRRCSAAVALLMRLGADVNVRDECGRTPHGQQLRHRD
jgi:ankyrin repeat protein